MRVRKNPMTPLAAVGAGLLADTRSPGRTAAARRPQIGRDAAEGVGEH